MNLYSSASNGRHCSTEVVQTALGTRIDDQDLFFDRQGLILGLFENFGEPLAAIQLLLRGLVQLRTKQRERGQVAILRKFQPKRTRHLSHGLDLRAAANAAHRKADIDGRAHVGVEQIGLQEDLAVGNGNDVGRDVGRNVAGLGLDDRQRGERTTAFLVIQFGGALQQTAMQVKNVAGIGLASWRTAQQQ